MQIPPMKTCYFAILFWTLIIGGLSPSAWAGAEPSAASSANSVWDKARQRGVSFRAIGQEPGWLLEITDGVEILLVTDYGENRKAYAYVTPRVNEETRRTRYSPKEDDTVIEIHDEPCMDSMSGEPFFASVKITTPQRTLKGCGRALLQDT